MTSISVQEANANFVVGSLRLLLINSGSFDISNLLQVVDVIIGNQSIQALVRPIAGISFAADGPTSDVLIAVLGGSSYALASSNGLSNINVTSISVQEANANLVVLLISFEGIVEESNIVIVATSIGIHVSPMHGFFARQVGSTNVIDPFAALNRRSLRSPVFYQRDWVSVIAIRKINVNSLTSCRVSSRRKRCKRYAHDNHEHGRQQSQQTSFKSRFLHVISPIH